MIFNHFYNVLTIISFFFPMSDKTGGISLEEAGTFRDQLKEFYENAEQETKFIRDVLGALKERSITKEVLISSKLGIEVNKLRKAPLKEDLAATVLEILQKWRSIMTANGVSAPPEKRPLPKESFKEAKGPLNVREKSVEMLKTALTQETEDAVKAELVAISIEEELYREFGEQTDQPYKAKLRSKYLNIKDAANTGLRHALLNKRITAEQFCAMSPAVNFPLFLRRLGDG